METVISDKLTIKRDIEKDEIHLYIDGMYRCTLSLFEVIRLDGVCCPEVIPAGPSGCPPKQ